jgi:alpha-1,2-mannosyltransferase
MIRGFIITFAFKVFFKMLKDDIVWLPSFLFAFICILLVRIYAAIICPVIISDCDEIFNYWEPMHYLHYNYGFQTWEYSPQYSIRSWAFILFHTTVGQFFRIIRLLMQNSSFFSLFMIDEKKFVFLGIRFFYAFFSAIIETVFYSSVSKNINPTIGTNVFIILLFSPGMFFASPTFLPSVTIFVLI